MASVLLIEPDRLLAQTIKKGLSRSGHKTVWMVELQAAINAVDKHLPDVIVMDLLLAQRSGVEFLFELRSYPEWANIPVVLISSIPEEEIAESGRSLAQLGVSRFLYKPTLELSRLAEAVDRLSAARV